MSTLAYVDVPLFDLTTLALTEELTGESEPGEEATEHG